MSLTITQINPIIDLAVRDLCYKPYPGHKYGCMNYNKKEGCPPNSPIFTDVFDLNQPVFAIINKFNLEEQRNKLQSVHPDWSKKKLECSRYWQPAVLKELKIYSKEFILSHPGYNITTCPEGLGVNVTETMKKVDIVLEWPPELFVYKIAIAAVERKCRVCGCTWYNGCRNGCRWIESNLCSNCMD